MINITILQHPNKLENRKKLNKKYLHISFIVLLLVLVGNFAYSQDPLSSDQIQSELKAKGINQDELIYFLSTKNLSIEDLEKLAPEQLFALNEELDDYIKSRKENKRSEKEKVQNSQVEALENDKTNPEKVSTLPAEEADVVVPIPEISRYGDQLFSNNNLKVIEAGENVPVPGKYILNVGDQVSVSIYGGSYLDQVFTIKDDGAIYYNNENRKLSLAGITLNEAREKISSVFSRIYVFRPSEISINVFSASTISLNIYGEVNQAGGFIISAVNSPINALVAAKGITKNGTYRNIKLIKDNGQNINIDLYQFLTSPESMQNVGLSNNDIIHVPAIQKEVTLKGAVRRPLNYELLENENINDLIKYSGGFSVNANRDLIQVTRYENSVKKIIDIDLNSNQANNFKLKNGDIIFVRTVESDISNFVSVTGQINNPGDFELEENMRISDLLDKLTLNQNTRTDLALLNRTFTDGTTKLIKINLDAILTDKNSIENIELQSLDKLLIWNKQRFTETSNQVNITGAVKFPGVYPLDLVNSSTISDLILYAGGLRRDASNIGVIYRKDPLSNSKIKYIRIDPKLAQTDKSKDIAVMPFDSIVIFQDEKLILPYQVEISGQVNKPGVYQYGENMTLKDLIVLSEGFLMSAQSDQIEVNRVIIKNNQSTEVTVAVVKGNKDLSIEDEASQFMLQPFDKVFVRTVPEFELQKVVTLNGEVRYPGNYVLKNDNEKLMEVIKRAGGLTKEAFVDGALLEREEGNVGKVIMNLAEAQNNSRSRFNYILKDKDVISIPKQEDIVTLQSATLYKRVPVLKRDNDIDNTISIAFFPGKNADFYIKEFGGGYSENADKKGIFVQHANGEISRTINYGLFMKYPEVRKGSIIVIPEKSEASNIKEDDVEKVDWNKVLNDSVAQAMSILTLLLLVERI